MHGEIEPGLLAVDQSDVTRHGRRNIAVVEFAGAFPVLLAFDLDVCEELRALDGRRLDLVLKLVKAFLGQKVLNGGRYSLGSVPRQIDVSECHLLFLTQVKDVLNGYDQKRDDEATPASEDANCEAARVRPRTVVAVAHRC